VDAGPPECNPPRTQGYSLTDGEAYQFDDDLKGQMCCKMLTYTVYIGDEPEIIQF
jgi:hypothetical protein